MEFVRIHQWSWRSDERSPHVHMHSLPAASTFGHGRRPKKLSKTKRWGLGCCDGTANIDSQRAHLFDASLHMPA